MRAIRRARLFGVLVFVVLMVVLAAWYFTFTSERQQYLVSRNARLLTTIATQVDNTIAAQERMFATFLRSGSGVQWFAEGAKKEVPSLSLVDTSRLPQGVRRVDFTPTSFVSIEGRNVWLLLSFTANARPDLGRREVRLALDGLLEPIFAQQSDHAFDTLVLASSDGRVLHAVGAQSADLMLTRLDQLQPVQTRRFVIGPTRAESTPVFKSSGASTGLLDAEISGSVYKLFSQPCCVVTKMQSTGADGGAVTASLVVVGLVNASKFAAKTREISPVFVIACIAVILLSLAGWPFLKIRLLGERQRAKRLDVIAVVACGVFGMALLTIVFLDLYAYHQLTRARDEQLAGFVQELSQAVHGELRDAYRQLACLTDAAPRPRGNEQVIAADIIDDLRKSREHGKGPDCLASSLRAYPFFQTFSLIDRAGMQRVKWSPLSWVPEAINVKGRSYFSDVIAGRWALHGERSSQHTDSTCPDGCALESIWSWTTTRPEAVISMPTADPSFPVAALAIRMRSLIRPIIPEHFEFAVIDDIGRVLFHSDPQRNTYENLFQETDQNRRLRAVLAGRSAETVALQYGGRSYRAHIDRLGVRNWSVVALYGNGPAWALHVEWLVIALTILVIYTLTLAALLAFCLWTRHSEWLWSDPRQVERYKPLALYVLGLLLVGSAAVFFVQGGLLILLSFMLPFAGWLVTYLVLRRPPQGEIRLRDAHATYASLAALLFLLTGVVPAAGFLTAAYDIQARTYVKHSQLRLAQAVRERLESDSRGNSQSSGTGENIVVNKRTAPDPYGLYYRFLFDSELKAAGMQRVDQSLLARAQAAADGVFTDVLEEYLPYYSDSSVQIRELLHDVAKDKEWNWTATQRGIELSLARLVHGNEQLVLESDTPRLWQVIIDGDQSLTAWLVILGTMLLATLAWAVVRFIETHICLINVQQPVWSRVRLAVSSGDNLFVVCDPQDRQTLAEGTHELRLQSIASSASPDQEWVRKLMEIDQLEPGRPVLLADFDERLEDPDLAGQKLSWIEELTHDQTRSIIVLSSASPTMLDHTLRIRLRNGATNDARLLERWRSVLASFVVVNWRADKVAMRPPVSQPSVSLVDRIKRMVQGPKSEEAVTDVVVAEETPPGKPIDERVLVVLRAEGAADAFVRAICFSIENRLAADIR
jgi:hypothetical protein